MSIDAIVLTKDLIKALSFTSSIVDRKIGALPILSHCLIDVKDNRIVITATDADMEVVQTIPAKVICNGAIVVHSITLSDIVRKISDQEVCLQFIESESKLNIHNANCSFNITTLPAEDFPIMEDINSNHVLELKIADFLTMLEHTKYAMSTEETRYNMTGVYIHSDHNNSNIITAVATDCHRLAVSSTKLEDDTKQFGIIIPSKAVLELAKIAKDLLNVTTRNLKIHIGHSKVRFEFETVYVTTKIVDGAFPEYTCFIPQSNNYHLHIPAKILATAIDRVATVTVEKFRAVKIVCTHTAVEIYASGIAKGDAHEIILFSEDVRLSSDYDDHTQENIIIGFNPKYILDALNPVLNDRVTISIASASEPVLIKAMSYPLAQFVVMPVNVL